MRSLILILSFWRNQYRGHHSQRTESGTEHIAHHVTIIVLACPDEATLATDYASHRIIYQRIEVFDAEFSEFLLVVTLVNLFEDLTELRIVSL